MENNNNIKSGSKDAASNVLTLADMTTGTKCIIVKVNGHGGLRHRLMELGFVKGETVTVIKNAPLLDPVEYQVMQAHISLRRSEADKIEVVTIDDVDAGSSDYNGTISEDVIANVIKEKTNNITVALVGNPNAGKTSFFNHATGLHEKVGNYSGVTVDFKVGTFYHNGYTINLVDLPGTYSITEFSPEERYVRDYLTKNNPDLVLNIVDASNLERNLFLTTQLVDMNVRIVMALNMYDEMRAKGDSFNYKALGKMMGFPIVPTTAVKGIGITEVLETIIDVYEGKKNLSKHIHINYGRDIEDAIVPIKKLIEVNKDIINIYPSRYIAINVLENSQSTVEEIKNLPNGEEIISNAVAKRQELEKDYDEDVYTLLTNARYAFIRGALAETYRKNEGKIKNQAYKADDVITNKWLGFPILIFFLWVMFQTTFTIGAYPQGWIESAVEWFGSHVASWMNEGILRDLIVDGIIAGVGGALVFLPNILILFFFISILEDTGYMARAAFIMDRLMHKIGLHGKSFIPFLIGFGCSVPAVMATRTLENRKDRIVTTLVLPFMSCSARLPVYLLFVAAFFDKNQGFILLSIYLIGAIIAILTALLLNKTAFKGLSEQFVMELPPYRIPTMRNTMIHIWDKSVQYLQKMATVILVASVIIWALEYFPRDCEKADVIAQEMKSVESNVNISEEEKAAAIKSLELQQDAVLSENSYMGRLGHVIEPMVRPCGFDWRMGVSLMTGIAAKEVVVSTLGVLLQASDEEESSTSLIQKVRTQRWTSGPKEGELLFTPLVAFGFMVFVLISTPCFATIAAVRREAGWKAVLFTLFYNTGIAWIVSFLIYQIGTLF
ncbi:MAG: ferrous iron transport protein B [Bacteroidales bacterium]|nr:ferrous iron transport protein B [Bacteroidales bacterium]